MPYRCENAMRTGDEKGKRACAYWRKRRYPLSARSKETILDHVWMHLGSQSGLKRGSARIEDIICETFPNATNCTRPGPGFYW